MTGTLTIDLKAETIDHDYEIIYQYTEGRAPQRYSFTGGELDVP